MAAVAGPSTARDSNTDPEAVCILTLDNASSISMSHVMPKAMAK